MEGHKKKKKKRKKEERGKKKKEKKKKMVYQYKIQVTLAPTTKLASRVVYTKLLLLFYTSV